MPVTEAPSQIAAPAPDPTPPAPPQPAPPPSAPAIGKPTMEISAPKDIARLNCSIATPEYPAMARRRGETGRVLVALTVGVTGKLENVRLQKSSGSSRLDDAAMDAVRSSACRPFLVDGQPVRVPTVAPFDFTLDN
jgi:periplasmic protein TonB